MVIACDRYEPPDLIGPRPRSEFGLVNPVVDHTRDVNFRPAHKRSTKPRNRTEIGQGPGGNCDQQPIDFDDKVAEETATAVAHSLGLEITTNKAG